MEDPNSQSTSGNSLISKVRSVITLEPAIFMCTLGYGLQSIISQVSFQKMILNNIFPYHVEKFKIILLNL